MAVADNEKLMTHLGQAFLDYGYDQATMVALARACDLTRRALYNHFSNKEEAFREMLRWRHGIEIEAGLQAGKQAVASGATAVGALVAVFDARYGEARRNLERSPHALEINHEAFRRCRDIMSASTENFQERLAQFIDYLAAHNLLQLKAGITRNDAAQLLADGARGVNQSLPARSSVTLAERYERMCDALLCGCAESKP